MIVFHFSGMGPTNSGNSGASPLQLCFIMLSITHQSFSPRPIERKNHPESGRQKDKGACNKKYGYSILWLKDKIFKIMQQPVRN